MSALIAAALLLVGSVFCLVAAVGHAASAGHAHPHARRHQSRDPWARDASSRLKP